MRGGGRRAELASWGLAALCASGCRGAELSGAAVAEHPGVELASYREGACVDGAGKPWPAQRLEVSLERRRGMLVLRVVRPDGAAFVVQNRFEDGTGLTFQAVLARPRGYALLWDFRIPHAPATRAATTESVHTPSLLPPGQLQIADRFAIDGDADTFRATVGRVAVACSLEHQPSSRRGAGLGSATPRGSAGAR